MLTEISLSKKQKPGKPLDKVEQRGYDSEALIAETLKILSIFPDNISKT